MNKEFGNRNRRSKIILLLSTLATFMSSTCLSQDTLLAPLRVIQREVPDDRYVPVLRERMHTSPAYRFSSPLFFTVQVNVDATGQNIVGDAANEPSIAVDPLNPSRMAIGWRQFDTVSNNFRQAGYGYTTDGGQTWTFPGVIEPGVFRSDPVLDSDSHGNFYYNSLTSVPSGFRCDVFKSSDGGVTWDSGTFARGGDKQWMTIDKSVGPGEGHIYAYWTSGFSSCPPGFFTRSTNRGASYENCVTIPNNPFWGTLAVGPDHELYVCGTGGANFLVAMSSNASDQSQTVSWDFSTAVNLGGQIAFGAGPNPGGLLGQTWIAVDHSSGPSRGNVYLLCSVNPFSGPDPLDVMFSRSTDGGVTWSPPIRVNDNNDDDDNDDNDDDDNDDNDNVDTTAWQWFGTMSVAPNGRIDVIWLDTRDNPGSFNSSLYYSYSTDAGLSWSQNDRLSDAFDPHVGWPQQNKMGDYFDMVSDNSGAHVAWAGTFNGEQDVYYGRIAFPLVEVKREHELVIPASFSLSQNYPNPFNPSTAIEFALPHPAFVTLNVFTILGQKVATLVAEPLGAARHTVHWDATGLSSGVYFYRLSATSLAFRELVPTSRDGQAAIFEHTKRLILVK